MVRDSSIQELTQAVIVNALDNIKIGQWVLYACSHPHQQFNLSDSEQGYVRRRAQSLHKSGQVMLFQKKVKEQYYYYARGVDPRVLTVYEKCIALVPFPSHYE